MVPQALPARSAGTTAANGNDVITPVWVGLGFRPLTVQLLSLPYAGRPEIIVLAALIALFAGASAAPWVIRRMGRSGFHVLAAIPAACFAWLVTTMDVYTGAGQDGDGPDAPPATVIEWIPYLDFQLAFRMDALSALMSLLILGVGALVLFYCARYFKRDEENLPSFAAQLLAFAGAMFGLVIADDLVLLFVFWELTTVASYLLIGYARHRLSARRAALQALLVTTFGGLAMLVGLIMLGQAAGTYRLSEIIGHSDALLSRGAMADTAVALILLGAAAKSALLPFHFWLPAAMAAPTPVSAYLHAAAMVKAGVYLVARLAPGFTESPVWLPMIMVLGLSTMLLAGWRALHQHDLKLILAYGTVSQLGFLVMAVGLGGPDGALAGLAMLFAHGLFKSALFLVAGVIDHQAGTRDIRELAGVGRAAPVLAVTAVLAAASMAGLPLMIGFVAKEAVFAAFLAHAGERGLEGFLLMAGIVVGSALTVAYSARFVWGGFAPKRNVPATRLEPTPRLFLAPPLFLAAAGVAFGLFPAPLEHVMAPYATLFGPGPVEHLAPWHGMTAALGLSVLALAVGAGLFLRAGRVGHSPPDRYQLPDAERGYQRIIGALDDAAVWVTGRTQRGSLPFYLVVILAVAIVVPLAALVVLAVPMPRQWHWFDSPMQAAAGAAILAAAIAAVRASKRFMAVLMVGVTGYGLALIFALQGAPDLALTQTLVETVVLVAFVLALRSLPVRFWERGARSSRVWRAVLGTAFGAAMAVIAAGAMAARTAAPVSLGYPRLAHDDGGGSNIVNVTLVDIRAWDTFGEVSVLAIAATGIASLIFIRGRGDTRRRAENVESGSVDRGQEYLAEDGREEAALALARKFSTAARDAWLVAGRTLAPERRSIIFEVVTRLLFHSVIVFSIYLLLAGHNLPGGGFSGGLLAGIALAVRYLAGGRFELMEASPVGAGLLLGIGLAAAALTALVPLFAGGQVFQSAVVEFSWPVFGHIKFVTSTLFDIGVYLIVVGLVLDVLRSLGAEIDERGEGQPASGDPVAAKERQQSAAPGAGGDQ
jgi:multicomponent Na+:H+ antiporter subunit A